MDCLHLLASGRKVWYLWTKPWKCDAGATPSSALSQYLLFWVISRLRRIRWSIVSKQTTVASASENLLGDAESALIIWFVWPKTVVSRYISRNGEKLWCWSSLWHIIRPKSWSVWILQPPNCLSTVHVPSLNCIANCRTNQFSTV